MRFYILTQLECICVNRIEVNAHFPIISLFLFFFFFFLLLFFFFFFFFFFFCKSRASNSKVNISGSNANDAKNYDCRG